MLPVTPVCFGTMYTGAQPAVHGIQKYEKPVIQIDTIFDALIRAGKMTCGTHGEDMEIVHRYQAYPMERETRHHY